MKIRNLLPSCLTALACVYANNAQAQQAPTLKFTEVSETQLTVTLADQPFGTVINTSPDHWEWHSGITLGNQVLESFIPFIPLQWSEPQGDLVNTVTFGLFTSLQIIPADVKATQFGDEIGALIVSDTAPLPDPVPAPLPNGGISGLVTLPELVVFAQFVDLGDEGTTVPDAGSTSILLLAASTALLATRRLASS